MSVDHGVSARECASEVCVSPCQHVTMSAAACVCQETLCLLRYFSTSDSSQPTPEVGGSLSFPPTENLKYPESREGVKVEMGICSHVTVLCASVFA